MLIHNGRLVFADEITKIKSRFRKLQLASLSHVITPEEIEAAGIGVMQYTAEGRVVRVITRDGEGLDEKIASLGAELSEQIPLSLEEIFIYEMDMKGYTKSQLSSLPLQGLSTAAVRTQRVTGWNRHILRCSSTSPPLCLFSPAVCRCSGICTISPPPTSVCQCR